MRKQACLFPIVCFLCLTITKNSLAQSIRIDSSSQQNAFNNATSLYYASIGNQSPIYNGTEYYFYDPIIKGNAYFSEVRAFTPGAVYFDRARYVDVPMLYDLYTDQLVVLLYNHFSKFALAKEKVKNFDFLGHHFVNISEDTLEVNSEIKSGFYDQLYGGRTEVLVKRSKSIQVSAGGTTGSESSFTPSTKYFIRKNNLYYSFSGQGSLLSILKDKRKELQQYIKANQIRYREDPEAAMVKIASFYDHSIK